MARNVELAVTDPLFTSLAEFETFMRLFESCQLPKSRWTHQAHLAAGLWYLSRHSPAEALCRVRDAITRHNESVGTVNSDTSGYHETITCLYLLGIATHIAKRANEPLLVQLDTLLKSPIAERSWPLTFYSRELLFSIAARRGWVEPDILPLEA